MATIQVILNGMPGGSMHDLDGYPVILKFDDRKSYGSAVWVIPSYPGHIPAGMLSEIRVQMGPITVFVEGPEGFQSGPYTTDWVRSDYPRGKLCSFLQMDASTQKMGGVSLFIHEDSLILDEINLGGPKTETPPATPPQGDTPSSDPDQMEASGEP
jgi:hypothetical protein